MKTLRARDLGPLPLLAIFFIPLLPAAAEPIPQTRPEWHIELVTEAPTLRHPSVVCTAPDGRIFVAEDPMDITTSADQQLGRILCIGTNGSVKVFAEKLYAVFGMQYLEGKLYVLQNPKFTVFTDKDGQGQDRQDLIEQTNPKPWALDWNDHVPANFRLAMDGYFYVAVGDKGLYQCRGRDGSEVNLHGGGLLRMRPDATELEIVSRGVRNILDVALNDEDEIFTYDNTDEHHWMGRLTHMVEAGFYGYPHDFIPRRPYTLWMMHDFGAGAACGAFANNEDGLPPEYRGNLFQADFGKRQVTRVQIAREGGTYRVVAHEDLFINPPADFRPVGIAPTPDGLGIYICDWQHRDVKEKDVSVGRLWLLRWAGASSAKPKPTWYEPLAMGQAQNVETSDLMKGLEHPARSVRLTAQRALIERAKSPDNRGVLRRLMTLLANPAAEPLARCHALWAVDLVDGGRSARSNIAAAANDSNFIIARQAIRQLGQRREPGAIPALVAQLKNADGSIRFQAATALGRIGATNSTTALLSAFNDDDLFARYASFTALNRIGRRHPPLWPTILQGLNSTNARVREATVFAVRETYDPHLVDALQRILPNQTPDVRATILQTLAAVSHQPPPWQGEWWAYHPAKAPPPARTVVWTGTDPILKTLRDALQDSAAIVRAAAAAGLSEVCDTNAAPALRQRLTDDSDLSVRRAALQSLARLRDPAALQPVQAILLDAKADPELSQDAIRLSPQFGKEEMVQTLSRVLELRSGPARAAALEALAEIGGTSALDVLRQQLKSGTTEERRIIIRAFGRLRDRASLPELLAAWQEPETKSEALASLCRLSDARALDVYLEGMAGPDATVREQCRNALQPIRKEVWPRLEERAATLTPVARAELRRVYAKDAELLKKPLLAADAQSLNETVYQSYAMDNRGDAGKGERIFFDERGVNCVRCHVVEGKGGTLGPDLSAAGAQFSRAQLIESILYPSRAVREGYQQIILETKDDEVISGALKADTADGVTLVDATGHTNFIARARLVERRSSELSLMPEGLQLGLSLQQFADLIAYLESKGKAAK